jgi:acyl carrier protein
MLSAEMDAADDRPADVEQRVRTLIAEMTGVSCAGGALRDAALDSLTLIAIVTRIEAAFAISFGSDEIVALLGAADPEALARLVARRLAAKSTNLGEPAGNGDCLARDAALQ